MEVSEVQAAFDRFRKQGYSDDEILVALGRMFEDDVITKDQLMGFAEALGAELSPEFVNAKTDEEAKKLLWKSTPTEAKEGMTEKQVEDSEVDPDGKSAPVASVSNERKAKDETDEEDSSDNGSDDEDSDSGSDEGEDSDNGSSKPENGSDDEDEKKQAFKLMGLSK